MCVGADDFEEDWKYVLRSSFKMLQLQTERQNKFLRCVSIQSHYQYNILPKAVNELEDVDTASWMQIASKPILIARKFDAEFLQLDYEPLHTMFYR